MVLKQISNNMKDVEISRYKWTAATIIIFFAIVGIMFCAYMVTQSDPIVITKNNYEYKEVPLNYTIKMETQDKILLIDRSNIQEVK